MYDLYKVSKYFALSFDFIQDGCGKGYPQIWWDYFPYNHSSL